MFDHTLKQLQPITITSFVLCYLQKHSYAKQSRQDTPSGVHVSRLYFLLKNYAFKKVVIYDIANIK